MAKPQPYTVTESVTVDVPDPQGGRTQHTFAKGQHSPKNEGEQAALDAVVASGFATAPGEAQQEAEA